MDEIEELKKQIESRYDMKSDNLKLSREGVEKNWAKLRCPVRSFIWRFVYDDLKNTSGAGVRNELFEAKFSAGQIEAELKTMQSRRDGRNFIYEKLSELFTHDEFYKFLVELDAGFGRLAWAYDIKIEKQWMDEYHQLLKLLTVARRKNDTLGKSRPFIKPVDLRIDLIITPYATRKGQKGAPKKGVEKFQIKRLLALLRRKESKENAADLVSYIFKSFYGINKSPDTIARWY